MNANRALICKMITSVVSPISINCQLKSNSPNVIHFNITRIKFCHAELTDYFRYSGDPYLKCQQDYEFMLNKLMKRLISVTTVLPDITPYYA